MNFQSQASFTEERFPSTPPQNRSSVPRYPYFAHSVVFRSWRASMFTGIVTVALASYMSLILSHPSLAFRLSRLREDPTSFSEFVEVAVCFFPYLLYSLGSPQSPFACTRRNVYVSKSLPQEAELWMCLPLFFAIFGSVLGVVAETIQLYAIQKKLRTSPLYIVTSLIKRLERVNLSFVLASSLFCSTVLVGRQETSDHGHQMINHAAMYGIVFLAAALAAGCYWVGFRVVEGANLLPSILHIVRVLPVIHVLACRNVAPAGGIYVHYALLLGSIAQMIPTFGVLKKASTPFPERTCLNVQNLAQCTCLYVALMLAGNSNPSIGSSSTKSALGENDYVSGLLIAVTFALGVSTAMKAFPLLYQAFRSQLSFVIWCALYFFLLVNPSPPPPKRLRVVYAGNLPKRIELQPYSRSHPYEMDRTMAIPSIAGPLPQTVQKNTGPALLQKITNLFDLFAILDRFLPQADIHTPLKQKERLAITEEGQERYPSDFFSLSLDFFSLPNLHVPSNVKQLQPAPLPAIESYKVGQYLAYLCQFGVGNSYLQPADETDTFPFFTQESQSKDSDGFVVDFQYMEDYEVKEDYERYGGIAFFVINDKKNLELKWVVAPGAHRAKRSVAKDDATFRRAESIIVSTLYFAVVAGKHLTELHMTYNLLEVANINMFDVALNPEGTEHFKGHPLRIVLYMHLFSHALAEELTTEHLVQIGSVFPQIFALKDTALTNYLTNTYREFKYASDEDFEHRGRVNSKMSGTTVEEGGVERQLPFANQLEWEREYYDIFKGYASETMKAVYQEDDTNVVGDQALQNYYKVLEEYFHGMPDRYQKFQTFAGLVTFVADTIHHLVIRHQFYGTTGTVMAFDPRIGCTQTPKDLGPQGVDEWRSLVFVGMATAHANYVPLLNDDHSLEDIFDDATSVPLENGQALSDGELAEKLKGAWKKMQDAVQRLQTDWAMADSGQGTERDNFANDYNYMYFRPLPQDCRLGPGF
ncbi:hypothetical protein ACA910_020323 [Epithemia clementina (nom. ined.)]